MMVLSLALLVIVLVPYHADGADYGLDVCFPIQRRLNPDNVDILGDRQSLYLSHLEGCRKAYPKERHWCDQYEYDRMLMNLRQPQSMKNYTKKGFHQIRAPEHVVELIDAFWAANKNKGKPEQWPPGNSYVNHWDSPTSLISVDDRGLRGSGPELKRQIWAAASATLEEWTQEELQPCSMYGIRVYHEGSIMLPHVDRLPLVASAMILVAQDVDEPWPLEVYDHETSMAHNLTMEPGDMILFESHSVIHGHPFPLKGRFQALLFIHFEPTGHSLEYNISAGHYGTRDVNEQYRESVKEGFGGQSSAAEGSLPPYIKRMSPEEEHWRGQHPNGWQPPAQVLPPEAHLAAKAGQLEELEKQFKDRTAEFLTERDDNGWQVLHQGVAGGNQEVVKFLVNHGAEINARTHGGYGETPLRIAEKVLGDVHPIVEYLKGLGALSIGPEL